MCTTHVPVFVIQATVIRAQPSFVHLVCKVLLMVSQLVFCIDTFVIMNEAIV